MREVKRYVCTGLREHTPTDYWADKLTIILVDASEYDQLKAEVDKQENNNMTLILRMQNLEAENERLGYEVEHLGVVGLQQVSAMLKAQQERDTLRKQLDEAQKVIGALSGVIVEQNHLGASWHPPVFAKMMAALSSADDWLAANPA